MTDLRTIRNEMNFFFPEVKMETMENSISSLLDFFFLENGICMLKWKYPLHSRITSSDCSGLFNIPLMLSVIKTFTNLQNFKGKAHHSCTDQNLLSNRSSSEKDRAGGITWDRLLVLQVLCPTQAEGCVPIDTVCCTCVSESRDDVGEDCFASVPPQERSMDIPLFSISIGDACHRHLLADCFVIYAGLKESKGHLSSNQERDESGPVIKFPVESGERIKGEKYHCFMKN